MRAVFNKLPEPGLYEVFEHPTGTAHISLDSADIGMLAEYEELEIGGEFIQPPTGKKYVSTIFVVIDKDRPDSATPTRIG